ncbi:retrovirus-related pol polyprotein from transposon TNT 1-94 [Tanacetum coccineum]|uniref:Retrovirus-related pol polyprotein from transposon TNT 1-94 n=1 Tax=Tanacetum coccineum TaxID=301880 RepID=A0ABQ5FF15_9ASTR
MMVNLTLLFNFVEKYPGTVYFGNDQFTLNLGYGDLVQGNIMINRVYYVEGLNHNLFSVGKFCDTDLEVAFRKSTYFVRDLQGNELLTDNRGSDLYTISLQKMTSLTPIYLMAKASPTQAWLWHRRLSHLNSDYINLLSKKDVVASINRKKYILVIVDNYSRYTWTLFLQSKDETPEVLKDFLIMIQRNLQAPASDYDNSVPVPQLQNVSPLAETTVSSQQELDLLFGPLYDEFFNTGTSSVNKSSSPTDNSKQQDTPPTTNIQSSTKPRNPTNVNAEENNNNQAEDTQFQQDEFINPFCTLVQEIAESSSINIDNLNMHTFY